MVGGGDCRLQMPLKLALAIRGTAAGHRLGALEGAGATSTPSKASLGPPLLMKFSQWGENGTLLRGTFFRPFLAPQLRTLPPPPPRRSSKALPPRSQANP